MRKETTDFLAKAGLSFHQESILETALTHSSWTFEHNLDKSCCNERLEFLGDAVLEIIVSLMLFQREPAMEEGRMTKIRSLLTREETLARVARDLGLGHALKLGKGEEASAGRDKASNLSNALEAVIAALYLDQGKTQVELWLNRLLAPYMEAAIAGNLRYDYKSALQEFVQARHPIPKISYSIVHTEGPDHARVFTSELKLNDQVISRGKGSSKKDAEQAASAKALEYLKREQDQ